MKRYVWLFLTVVLLLSCLGCDIQTAEIPTVTGWTLAKQERQQLADGVIYTQFLFSDSQNLPHIVYILTIDPNKATLHTGTSQNGFDLMPYKRQNVMEHAQASTEDGLHVIAAVNRDFFAINSSYMPSGLCIKNGVQIRYNTSYRPYSAITKDGKFIISDGKSDKIDPNTLDMAVGGSHVIVQDGQIHNVDTNNTFSTTSHPRTLAGVKEDGTIILAVIDGRQLTHSNGATLTQCAQLMRSLGAVRAINHDGGGSSTMILRNSDHFETVNRPSDGNLRAVYNSIQVILKDGN